MRAIFASMILLLAAAPALAERWTLFPDQSELSFTYTENGRPMPGSFPQFSGWAEFDPDTPQDSSVFIQVNTEAVQMSDFVRTAFARTGDWFATTSHPIAQFELTALVPKDDLLEASGVMTVKGRSRPVVLDVTLEPQGDCLRARGMLPIDLADFNIGRGTVSRLIQVGDMVTVTFDLIGKPEGGAANCG